MYLLNEKMKQKYIWMWIMHLKITTCKSEYQRYYTYARIFRIKKVAIEPEILN
jgi:hypothetical protein